MISKRLRESLDSSICIRDIFEEGKKLAAIYGAENIFNFTIGNPSVEPPAAVNEALKEIIDTEKPLALHGYPANVGHPEVRNHIANYLNGKYDCNYTEQGIIMTSGAAAAIVVIANTLLDDGDEVVTFAPYFWEYKSYVETMYGKLVPALCNMETLQPDPETFEAALSPKTRFVLINTPNNPTGAVYTEESIRMVTDILKKKQEEYGHPIYLVSDEPYRKLAYDIEVPYLTHYYENTIVVYSYSKALSIPGERIGYIAMEPCVDISIYQETRDILYNALTEIGYTCIHPDGAFYLFVKALEEDDTKFCERAKEEKILMAPGTAFYGPGWVRVSYCVPAEVAKRSIPAFQRLYDKYQAEQVL